MFDLDYHNRAEYSIFDVDLSARPIVTDTPSTAYQNLHKQYIITRPLHLFALSLSVCQRSQTAGRNSCSIVSGNVSNCSYHHGSSPPTSLNDNELSGDNILWSRLIASGPSERRQHERRQLRSKMRQREFIPSRLENVVKELVRSL